MPVDQADDTLVLRHYLAVLRRRGWIVVVTTFLVTAAAVGLSLVRSKVYEGEAKVLILRRASDQVLTLGTPQAYDPERAVQTEVKVLESRTVADAAVETLGHEPDIRIESDPEADVITVVARSRDPRTAARDANVYAQTYVDYRLQTTVDALLAAGRKIQDQINQIDRQLATTTSAGQRAALEGQRAYLVEQLGRLEVSANLASAGGAELLARAEVPDAPVSPNPVRNGLLGALVGLLLGLGVAFLVERLDDTLTDREALEHTLGEAVPVLGEIPHIVEGRKSSVSVPTLVTVWDPSSLAAEAFGMLRTSILFLGVDQGLRTIQVTSASAEEGKSTVAANLAVSLAKAGKRAVLVDLDLRRPAAHTFFGMSNGIGFSTIMLDEATPNSALRLAGNVDRLAVLPSGTPPPNPSELLTSPRVPQILGALADIADILVVDSPPLLPVADALTIARLVDATILVARAGVSSRRALHAAVTGLRQVDARLAGVVLNDVSLRRSYYGYRRYPSAYHAPRAPQAPPPGAPGGHTPAVRQPSEARAAASPPPPRRTRARSLE